MKLGPLLGRLGDRGDGQAFLRYLAVGLAQNGISYVVALGLIFLGLAAWQVVVILNPLAVLSSFLLNRAWSFAGRPSGRESPLKYAFVYAVLYPVAIVFTWAIEAIGVPSWLAILITLAVLTVAAFLALNLWVFRRSEERRKLAGT